MRYSSKIARLSVFVLSAILLISIAVSFFADSVIKDWLEGKVAGAGEGQYSLQLEDLEISLLQNKIHLSGIFLKTDSSGLENQPFVEAEARELTLTGISVFNYFFDDELKMDQLLLEGLNLKLQVKSGKEGSSKPFKLNTLDIYPKLREFADQVRIDQFSIQNSSLEFQSQSKEDTVNLSVKVFNTRHEDLLIGEGELFTSSRTFYSDWSDIKAEQVKYSRSGAKNVQVETEMIYLHTEQEQGKLKVGSLTFLQKQEAEPDTLFFLSLDLFDLEGFDLNKLQEEKLAVSEKARISELQISFPESLDNPGKGTKESTSAEQEKMYQFSIGNHLPGLVEEIKLENLEIRGFSLTQGNSLSLKNAYLLASDISIDDQSAFSKNKFFHAGVIETGAASLNLNTGEPAHQLRLSGFYLEAEDGKGNMGLQHLEGFPAGTKGTGSSYSFITDQLSLSGINTRRFNEGIMEAENLLVSTPMIKVQLNPETGNSQSLNQERGEIINTDLANILPGYQNIFKEIRLNELELFSSDFSLRVQKKEGEFQKFSYKDLSLKGEDILIAENSMFNESRAFFAAKTDLEIRNMKAERQGAWKASAGFFSLRNREEAAFISARSVNYLQQAEADSDTLQYVKLQYFDLAALNLNRFIIEQSLSLEKAAFKDLIYLSNPTAQGKESPNQQEMNQAQAISSLSLGNYLPKNIKELEIGELELSNAMLRQGKSVRAEKVDLLATDILVGREGAWADKRFLHAATVENHFEKLTLNFGEPNHRISLGEVNLKTGSGEGNLQLQDILVTPDETSQTTSWVEAEIEQISLNKFITRNLSSRSLQLDSLLLGAVKMVYHTPESSSRKGSPEDIKAVPDLYPLIQGQLDSLKINSVYMPEADIRLAGTGGSFYGLHLPKAQLQLRDILIARGNAYLHDRVLHATDIRLQASSGILLFPDRVYSLLLKKVRLSTGDQTFRTENLWYGFSDNYKKILEGESGNELYRLISGGLLAEGIVWQKLFRDRQLIVNSFALENPDVYVYKNFNYPEPDVIKPMPYDMVHSLPFPVYIKEVVVNDMELRYEEMAEGAETAGLVDLTDMNVRIMNLTNMKSILVQEPEMTLLGSGKLMGKGDFESTISVPLLDETRLPRIRGSLDTLDITELNRIARYNSRVAIETGILYEVKWDFEAGEDYSYGDFEVSYENLTIQLSEPDSPDTTGLLKKAGSFLANVLVVDSNIAEEKSQEPKKVQFEQKRDKKRSFFNFYVKSLLGGLIEAVGVPFN